MRILFSPDDKIVNKNDVREWGVDSIVLPSEINNNHYCLPESVDGIIFFIPTIINQNLALNYDGVEFALHLYFQILRRISISAKIVLLGIEGSISFMMNFSYPKILRCPGFDYILLNKFFVRNYDKGPILINIDEAKQAIGELGLKLPESYRTNHSFINEWCYYKWSEYMGFDYGDITNKLNSNIFFDFLRTEKATNIKKVSKTVYERINNLKGNILLIDDSKYWCTFFSNFFNNNKNVKIKCIGNNIKHFEIDSIVELCNKTTAEFNPDIILLDFRLNEDIDYNVRSRNDISGVRVLRKLKWNIDKKEKPAKCEVGVGFGSRILMFTATGKIDHILELQHLGADGFIFKEHPDRYIGKASTKDYVGRNLLKTIEDMLACAPVAKTINNNLIFWLNTIKKLDITDSMCIKVNQVVEIMRSLMNGNFLEYTTLKLLYLEGFSILECLKNNNNDKIYDVIDLFASKNNLDSKRYSNWTNINKVRTSLAHGNNHVELDSPKRVLEVTPQLLAEWLITLCDFVSGILNLYTTNRNQPT